MRRYLYVASRYPPHWTYYWMQDDELDRFMARVRAVCLPSLLEALEAMNVWTPAPTTPPTTTQDALRPPKKG